MDDRKQLLVQAMALLMSTTPETTLGRFLNFCLATKVETAIAHKTPFEFAEELMEHPEKLTKWITEAIDGDDDYTVDEMIALSEMHLQNPHQFMSELWRELDQIKYSELHA
ncbi:MAG: hypothetical protein VKL39_00445 [Leptolyngbyaceae bacterium]|nr:hypothetical protein [Leptolyngbyaceae bacterium]